MGWTSLLFLSSSSSADGLAAQRQQLQAAHSTAVPHPLPVPEGSGQVQKVKHVPPLTSSNSKQTFNGVKNHQSSVVAGFIFVCLCPRTAPAVF